MREDIGDLAGVATSLISRARVLENLGDRPAAFADATRALRICRDFGDQYREAEARCAIARFHHDSGRYDAALRHARQALAIRERIADEHGVAAALRHAEEALRVQRRTGDRPGQGVTLDVLARLGIRTGRYREAAGHAAESLRIRREIANPPSAPGPPAPATGRSSGTPTSSTSCAPRTSSPPTSAPPRSATPTRPRPSRSSAR
jgi:tetratricopeptide (TPR) repeat protein